MIRPGHRALMLIAILGLATSPGCRSLSLPSFALMDKLPFGNREVVPPEIRQRHGLSPSEQVAQIDQLGRRAEKESPQQQQMTAENLARQITVTEDSQIRLHLIRAVSRCRVPLATDVLKAGLKDPDLDVQLAACAGLGERGGEETTSLLGEIVRDDSQPLDLRLAAIDSLGRRKDPATAVALAAALQPQANPALQFRAVRQLKTVTGLDYGDDLMAWRNHFGQTTTIATASPPDPGPASWPTVQAGWQP